MTKFRKKKILGFTSPPRDNHRAPRQSRSSNPSPKTLQHVLYSLPLNSKISAHSPTAQSLTAHSPIHSTLLEHRNSKMVDPPSETAGRSNYSTCPPPTHLSNSIANPPFQTTGPISIAAYMRQCLTSPSGGYYTSIREGKDQFGQNGDFITSPEISQMFGELVGIWLISEWMLQGRKKSGNVLMEVGPGRGTLMDDVLRVCMCGYREESNCLVGKFISYADWKISQFGISPLWRRVSRLSTWSKPARLFVRHRESSSAEIILWRKWSSDSRVEANIQMYQ
jgi:hypothetical protein